jgi:uncharacterized metal-binding protein
MSHTEVDKYCFRIEDLNIVFGMCQGLQIIFSDIADIIFLKQTSA